VATVTGEPGDECRADMVEADQPAVLAAGQRLDFDCGGNACEVAGDRAFAGRLLLRVVDGHECA
jgi:hypothetical protein